MSYSAKVPPLLLYLDYLKTFKTLNGEALASWSCLLSLLGFMCRIVLGSSLQEWCGVKLSRCEMWAQAVGEIHFLCLHRDDRETGRPSACLAVTNSRWQPQSEELASNDNVFEEVIAGDNRAKHLFVAIMWNTLYHFLLDRTLSTAICPQCNIYQWHRFTKKWTICLWGKVICLYLFFNAMGSSSEFGQQWSLCWRWWSCNRKKAPEGAERVRGVSRCLRSIFRGAEEKLHCSLQAVGRLISTHFTIYMRSLKRQKGKL